MPRRSWIAVIDERDFRRSGLTRLLEPWADIEKLKVVSFDSFEGTSERLDYRMLIFSVGAELLSESKAFQALQLLRTRSEDARLVVISDSEDVHNVGFAISRGAHGYIFSGTSSSLAFQALSFILHGGIYFPPRAIRELPAELAHDAPMPEAAEAPGGKSGSGDAPAGASPLPEAGSAAGLLTSRQREVLVHIRLGESNKVIGRHLGMTEGTVKVHVRQIMRKLGAANRTQLAVGRTGRPMTAAT